MIYLLAFSGLVALLAIIAQRVTIVDLEVKLNEVTGRYEGEHLKFLRTLSLLEQAEAKSEEKKRWK